MEFTSKLLNEHAELTVENAILKWKIERYKKLFKQVMDYLCEEDVLAAQYVIKCKLIDDIDLREKCREAIKESRECIKYTYRIRVAAY